MFSVVAILFCSIATAGPLVVRNASFEDDVLADGEWLLHTVNFSYWQEVNSNSGPANVSAGVLTPEAPAGSHVCFLGSEGGYARQYFMEADESTFIDSTEGFSLPITFYAGRGDDWTGEHPAVLTVELVAEGPSGWQSFGPAGAFTVDFSTVDGPAPGQWKGYSTVLSMTNVPGDYLDQRTALMISNTGSGAGANVFLNGGAYVDIVPEPATLGVLALGGLALIRRRRVS
jgi:hypothetical protein